MALPVRPPQPAIAPFEQRRGTVQRVEELAGGVFRCAYQITVAGIGGTTVRVNFPVEYPDRPGCEMGGSLAEGYTVVAGAYPWCSAVAGEWVRNVRGYYVGALVVIVVGGDPAQEMVVDFAVEGKALQPPL